MDRWEITPGMVTSHFGSRADGKPWQPVNAGVGVFSPDGWTAGVYRNSYDKPSVWAGREFGVDVTEAIRAALMLGAVTGYPAGDVLPVVIPQVQYAAGDHRVSLGLMPPSGKTTKGGLTLQYRRAF